MSQLPSSNPSLQPQVQPIADAAEMRRLQYAAQMRGPAANAEYIARLNATPIEHIKSWSDIKTT